MPYAYSNFEDLKAALGFGLNDSDSVHWTDTEKGIYLNFAFREFNAISRIFRDRGSFETASGTPYYDLTANLRNGSNDLILAPVITDDQLIQQIKYMLIEPNPDNTTDFTDGVTLIDIQNSLTRHRNEFLLETGLLISSSSQVVTAGEGIIQLPDTVIDVRRATWTDLDGNVTQLFREDSFTSSVFSPSWPQSMETPQRYALFPQPLITLQLIPPPVDNGTLALQTISSGSILDDFTPTILWGVLADVLGGPGPGHENLRASYAEQRWQEGLIVGRQVATVMQSYINGAPVTTESVFNFDTFQPSWQVEGTPGAVGLLGSNLAVVAPAADGTYSVVMDVARNAPQLVDGNSLPLGREYLDMIVNYAEHLCRFKHGGPEFQGTFSEYDSFVKAALAYNNRMNAQNLNFPTLVDKVRQQEEQQPLREVVTQ